MGWGRVVASAPLLTPIEAAERLHVSERTLRDLKRRGLIRYVAITQRRIAYRAEDCDEFVSTRVRVDEPCDTRPPAKQRSSRLTGKIIPFSRR